MANNIQETLNFLYKIAIKAEGVNDFEEDNFIHGKIDDLNSINNFNKKEIYDELTDFAFLTLYNNSLIKIDDDKLTEMVRRGIFTRRVNEKSFEGVHLKREIVNGTKTDKGIEIINQYGQKSIVTRENKDFIVTTKCPSILAFRNDDIYTDVEEIVHIIRNNLVHNRFQEISEKEKELYSDIFKNDAKGKGYIFKNYGNSVEVLVTESWLREFKKIYFLDSYCYVYSEDNVFYFPRFISARKKPIKDEEELKELLNSLLHTSITIYDKDKNYMQTKTLIEEDLFLSVFNKDKKLKYFLDKNKGKEEIKEKLKEHHLMIEEYITKTLQNKGYKDFKIEFKSEVNEEEKDKHYEFFKNRLRHIDDFYNEDTIDEQIYCLNRMAGIIPTTGFDKKENLKGITPPMISLFLSIVESLDKKTIMLEKLKALNDFVLDEKNLENDFLINKLNSMVIRKTPTSIENAYGLIENKIDTNKYNKVVIDNYFDSYFANIELMYVVCCASLYNAIIGTGFYEKILRRNEEKEYFKLEKDAYKSILKMNMDHFEMNTNGEFITCKNYGDKMKTLSYIRNVLLHGGAEIDYSSITDNLEDTKILFKSEYSNIVVRASVANIMELTNQKVLYDDLVISKKKKNNNTN